MDWQGVVFSGHLRQYLCMTQRAVKPWEQQEGEDGEGFERFVSYLNMERSERSISACYRKVNNLPANAPIGISWRDQATRNRWKERALAWDREVDKRLMKKLADRRLRSLLPTADLGALLREKAMQGARAIAPIEAITQTMPDGRTVMILKTPLTPEQIVKMAEVGVKLEQLAIGNPTERSHLGGDAEAPLAVTLDSAKGVLRTRLEAIQKRRAEAERTAEDDDEGDAPGDDAVDSNE